MLVCELCEEALDDGLKWHCAVPARHAGMGPGLVPGEDGCAIVIVPSSSCLFCDGRDCLSHTCMLTEGVRWKFVSAQHSCLQREPAPLRELVRA